MASLPASRSAVTRQRLLEAAAAVFHESGYDGATTRAISERAQANIAAISYHFSSKENLFREVLRLPLARLDASIALFADPGITLPEALHRMFDAMLAPLRPDCPEAMAMRLMARTMAAPHGEAERPDASLAHRHNEALAGVLLRHLPAGVPRQAADLLAGCLVGMAMHAVLTSVRSDGLPRVIAADPDDAAVDAMVDRLAVYGMAMVEAERRTIALPGRESWAPSIRADGEIAAWTPADGAR